MDQLILSVASDLSEEHPPYPAPNGFIWRKDPDEFDHSTGVIWEGAWNLILFSFLNSDPTTPTKIQKNVFSTKTTTKTMTTNITVPKTAVPKIFEQRKIIEQNLDCNYHVCNHKTHDVCTRSPCCDFFFHDGCCKFISDDGGCGLAVRFGE